MNNIKTYVRKFAKDVLSEYKPPIELKSTRPTDYRNIQAIYDRKKEAIMQYVKLYEYGYINYIEATKKICEEA